METEFTDAYQNNSSLKKPNVNEIPEIEMKSKGIDGIILGEKKNSKIRASKDVSLDTANKPKEMEGGRRDVRVLNTVKNNNAGAKSKTAVESQKVKCAVNSENREIVVSCPLPKGISLTNVSGIELPPEDVGHALQFLEFCAVFGKALNVKKGEPEALLKELIHRRSGRQGKTTVVDHFHIKLLSLIQRDSGIARPTLNPANGRHLWLKALVNLFSGSGLELKDLQLDSLDGIDVYYDLDLTRKLRLLNFLCE
ncbi:Zinc-finger domain of monoamine-oxidase A repressor R1 protein [Quillaja saponaria]|uniref:Zinc-finger domain of monoamine-oxidase A repressor R1 protein n=1 Tax=Quillaja saponaria TaxID=32244 RepID=A0AAD7VHJ7_QUISA|nr:Zinc-finger domain of monoamine-oxidase A repressor R1 protein [Quillaja saponaria]